MDTKNKEPNQRINSKSGGCLGVVIVIILFAALTSYFGDSKNGSHESTSTANTYEILPENASAYSSKDMSFMQEEHSRVKMYIEIGQVGLLGIVGMQKGLKITVYNTALAGTVNSINFFYVAYDPFNNKLAYQEKTITDLDLSPQEVKTLELKVTNLFGGNPIDEAERAECEVKQIKWSNGVVTE